MTMSPTLDLLAWVQLMLFQGRTNGMSFETRDRLERIEGYLIRRVTR